MTRLTVVWGDITREAVDAIVNAANSSLLGGGGVDGAIHSAGGSEILEACKAIRAEQGRCAPGDAVVTTAGRLPAEIVVHTVGPVWQGGSAGEAATLASCYRRSIELASSSGAASIAFPCISTGAYGYPPEEAAEVAIRAVRGALAEFPMDEVRFVVFSEDDLRIYEHLLGA